MYEATPSTTLVGLLTPLLVANPFSTVRASLRRWSSEEFEDGLTHGWQGRLRWRPVDSFFPPCCCEPAMLDVAAGAPPTRARSPCTRHLSNAGVGVTATKIR